MVTRRKQELGRQSLVTRPEPRNHTLSEMTDDARGLRANSTDTSDEIACLLFLQILPEEYDVFRQIIEREQELLTIDRLMGELRARFDLSRKVKSRSPNTALVASGSRLGKGERFGAISKMMEKKQSDWHCYCVCVFSSHPFWTSSSLDVPAGVAQEEGHTGFSIHLPSAVRALIFVARRVQPFLSLVDREVEFCVLTN